MKKQTGMNRQDSMTQHLIPAEKGLNPEWIRRLSERGVKEVYRGKALETIGMPCGGIGAGQLYLCGDGTLGSWQIFNNPATRWSCQLPGSSYGRQLHEKPVEQGFWVQVHQAGQRPVYRCLSQQGFSDVEFQGEYPIGRVRYGAPDFPVTIELEAFSPFIPLNAKDSAFPATLFLVHVHNLSGDNLRVSAGGWLENAVCRFSRMSFDGLRQTRVFKDQGCGIVFHSARETAFQEQLQRETIVFEDFEGADYGDWIVEGDAFGIGPAQGTLPNQLPVGGFQGRGLVNTYLQGDQSQGTLTSPCFKIQRRFINFLIGGGAHPGRTCMNLEMDGKVVHTATGENSEELKWKSWRVDEFEGKLARLVIVDRATESWGHICVDQIEFSDQGKFGGVASLQEASDYGNMTLACLEPELREQSKSSPYPPFLTGVGITRGTKSYPLTEKRLGLIRTKDVRLAPGKKHVFTFVFSWYFPNRPDETYIPVKNRGNYYAGLYRDSLEVAHELMDRCRELIHQTRLWRDVYYDSTLPYWLLDRLHSTVSYLATETCQWWRDGRFWAYEGVACCHGTCTHVWNYAHAHARLFPELARCIRRMQDFHPSDQGGGYHPDTGLVGFRGDHAYAADGQCGTILKAYREHLMSADHRFLRSLWSRIKRALEYSISQDDNEDGLIEGSQHNTYDINYHGANTLSARSIWHLFVQEKRWRVKWETWSLQRECAPFLSGEAGRPWSDSGMASTSFRTWI